MPQMLRALPWAIAILAITLLGAAEIIPADLANSLVTMLPLFMVAIVAGSARCSPQEG